MLTSSVSRSRLVLTLAAMCVLSLHNSGVTIATPLTLEKEIDGSSEFDMSRFTAQHGPPDPCLDEAGRGRRCVPDFVNVAFGRPVEASSTCGATPDRICRPSTDREGRPSRSCFMCDSTHPKRQHPASFLTDLNNPNNLTCWYSEPFHTASSSASPASSAAAASAAASSLLQQVIKPSSSNVTLKISFGKKFELTYISMQFCSPRPDSLAIFKSVDYGRSWLPFQFYSSQCRKVYGRSPRAAITKANEQEALCSDVYASVDPLSGTRVAFSTLEGRPSASDFDNSPVLQVVIVWCSYNLYISHVRARLNVEQTR